MLVELCKEAINEVIKYNCSKITAPFYVSRRIPTSPPAPPPLHPSSPPSGELHATSALRGSLWNVIQLYGVPEKMSRIVKLLHSDTQCCVRPPRGILFIMAYTVRLCPKGVPFSRLRYIKG